MIPFRLCSKQAKARIAFSFRGQEWLTVKDTGSLLWVVGNVLCKLDLLPFVKIHQVLHLRLVYSM